jgi:DNA end-binding protein Ku
VESAAAQARGVWTGSLSFGLVTVPIELYAAQLRGTPALRMLSPEGEPLERQYVCPEHDRALEPDEIVRGYEVAEGRFVPIDDAELRGLAPRRSRNIEITRFVARDAIDPAFFERAYFMLPAGEQDKAYGVLARAMESSGRAALGQFVMREHAYAVAIFADAGLLRAAILRFGDELRTARSLGLKPAPEPDAQSVKRMQRAIHARARDQLDPGELRDEETERLLALGRRKLARGKDVIEVPEAREPGAPEAAEGQGGQVIDLVALLRRQLRAPAKPYARRKQAVRRKRANR